MSRLRLAKVFFQVQVVEPLRQQIDVMIYVVAGLAVLTGLWGLNYWLLNTVGIGILEITVAVVVVLAVLVWFYLWVSSGIEEARRRLGQSD